MWYIQTSDYPRVDITQSDIHGILQNELQDKAFKTKYYDAQKRGQFLLLKNSVGKFDIVQFIDFPDVDWCIYHPKPDDGFEAPNKGAKQIKSIVHLLAKSKHNSWYHSSHNSALTLDEKYFQALRDEYQAQYYINLYQGKLEKEKDQTKKKALSTSKQHWVEKKAIASEKKLRIFQSLTEYSRVLKENENPTKVFNHGKFAPEVERRHAALEQAHNKNKPIPKHWHALKKSNKENQAPNRNAESMVIQQSQFTVQRNASNFYF